MLKVEDIERIRRRLLFQAVCRPFGVLAQLHLGEHGQYVQIERRDLANGAIHHRDAHAPASMDKADQQLRIAGKTIRLV